MTRSEKNRVALIAAIVAGAAMVAFALFFFVNDQRRIAEAESWSTVRGTVVAAKVDRKSHRGPDGYEPQLFYTYSFAGNVYRGNTIWLTGGQEWSSFEGAAEFLDSYPVGAEIEVRFNPSNPSQSALNVTENNFSRLFLIGGGGLFFLLGGIISLTLKPRRPSSSLRRFAA